MIKRRPAYTVTMRADSTDSYPPVLKHATPTLMTVKRLSGYTGEKTSFLTIHGFIPPCSEWCVFTLTIGGSCTAEGYIRFWLYRVSQQPRSVPYNVTPIFENEYLCQDPNSNMGEDVGISYKTHTLKDPAQSRYSNNRDKTSSCSGPGRSTPSRD